MSDRQPAPAQTQTPSSPSPEGPTASSSLRRLLHDSAPNSTQFVGFLTLLVCGAILLAFTGLTVTAAATGLLFFAPIILISSPLWVPAAAVAFVVVAGLVTSCGAAVAAVGAATWVYRYMKGRHPVGSERVDYARSRIADRARDVKDYAAEHGIYLTGRIMHAAPGA